MKIKTIKFNSLTQEQKNAVQVLFVNSATDVMSEVYLKLDSIDKLNSCYDTLLALGLYGISFFVKDNIGEYSLRVLR